MSLSFSTSLVKHVFRVGAVRLTLRYIIFSPRCLLKYWFEFRFSCPSIWKEKKHWISEIIYTKKGCCHNLRDVWIILVHFLHTVTSRCFTETCLFNIKPYLSGTGRVNWDHILNSDKYWTHKTDIGFIHVISGDYVFFSSVSWKKKFIWFWKTFFF